MGSTRRPARGHAGPRPARAGPRLRERGLPLAVLLAVAVAGLLYLAARETSMFAVRALVVSGVPEQVADEVRAALRPYGGESLAALDAGDVERRIEALPSVRAASVDRDFPHTLRVRVVPERPVAVVRRGEEAWVVAATGTAIRKIAPASLRSLPRIWLPAAAPRPVLGRLLGESQGAHAARALAAVPAWFPERIATGRGLAGDLTLVLAGSRAELRLGDTTDVPAKLAVAATVLEALSPGDLADLAYLDVSLPERVVASQKSQVVVDS